MVPLFRNPEPLMLTPFPIVPPLRVRLVPLPTFNPPSAIKLTDTVVADVPDCVNDPVACSPPPESIVTVLGFARTFPFTVNVLVEPIVRGMPDRFKLPVIVLPEQHTRLVVPLRF